LADEAVYLVPIGLGRFELYTEPADDTAAAAAPAEPAGLLGRTVRRLLETWHELARAAHAERDVGAPPGRLARGRDWLVRRIAESIAEQRTLWSLRGVASALFVHPSNLSSAAAAAIRERLLTHRRRHHRWWLIANLVGVAVTAILVLLPGPNLIGYYFVYRAIGHFLSWRGARQALERIAWTLRPEDALAELGELAQHPREERAGRVAVLAARLQLPRLVAFFDRVAVPTR
jgi:Mitochondrial K+-H+ exchange-related